VSAAMSRLRILLVVVVACGMTALTGLIFRFLGAVDTDVPDPTWQRDFAAGVLLGAATQTGLVLSLWAGRKGPAARAFACLLMLPSFASCAFGGPTQILRWRWVEAVVWISVLATYSMQFARLYAAPSGLSRRLAAGNVSIAAPDTSREHGENR
jgi:hypothetical protein